MSVVDDLGGQSALIAEAAERELIGSVLLDPIGAEDAFRSVPLGDYYVERHRIIARSILGLLDEGYDLSAVTLVESLRAAGHLERVGSLPYVIGLGDLVSTAAYVDSTARLVSDRARRRELVSFAQETAVAAKDPSLSLDEVYGDVERRLTMLRGDVTTVDIDDYAEEALATLDGETGAFWRTGIGALDRIVGGFKGLTILAARPSMGKSSLMRDMLRHNALRLGKVALFTNDQSGGDVLAFEASRRSGIMYHAIKTRTARPSEVARWRDAVYACRDEYRQTFLVDHRMHAVDVLASRVRAAVRWGAGLIAVDYLQNVPVPGARVDNLTATVSLVSKALKGLAQETGVPILALAQLSRAVESRKDRRPIMADIRESGQVEQDAEAVVFLYRDEYYRAREEGRGEEVESYAEVNVAKNKTGPCGTARLIFDSRYATFRGD